MKFGLRSLLSLLPAFAAALYFLRLPAHPPGFAIDESSICYNAYTISQTGQDEYGVSWPLFFRAFGEYKNPTIIYLLAALFKITGPSVAAARLLAAILGVLSAALLGLLAWQISRRWVSAALVTVTALLTPWLFESSRLVFEVALYPALVVLFLMAVWRAAQKSRWNWSDVCAIGVTLALLTYSYSIGRLLGPLLAIGLAFFITRERWLGVLNAWLVHGLLLVPMVLFHQAHPEALTGRFKALAYFRSDTPALTNLKEFGAHYLANLNPWRWLVTGENNVRDHLEGNGSLLAVSVLLALLGLAIVLIRHRRDPWWRFLLYALLVSPVPASLTNNPFPQLRLVAFPVFFLIFMIPALMWLTADVRSTAKRMLLGAAVVLLIGQGLFFQWRYHKEAPKLWYVFDARFPRKVFGPALATGQRPIYLLDEPGKSGYIHALWYGVLNHLDTATFVRLPWGQSPPPGAVVISTEEDCRNCGLIARALNYIVYRVPPFGPGPVVEAKPLSSFQGNIICENPRSTLVSGAKVTLNFLIRNVSAVEWPCLGDSDHKGAVTLEGRWRDEVGTILPDHGAEKRLPYDLEPGDTAGLALEITAPATPGKYLLEVDLVQKQVVRFSDRGSTLWSYPVTVTAQ